MDSEFLIKIPGKGLSLEEIASSYLELIEDDFNITIEEMADYLSCSYDYVQRNIAPCIYHVYINSVANKALFTHCEGSKYVELFTKRKLFSRSEFQQFLLKESVLLVDRQRYYLDELSIASREKMMRLAKKQEQKTTTTKMFETIALQQTSLLYSKTDLMNKVVEEFPVSELPMGLYSLKDLLDGIDDLNLKFRYKVSVYRYLEKQGIPKVKIQSLIRYRREDLENTAVYSLPLIVDKKEILASIEKMLGTDV
ncbi:MULTISPECIES: MerR family transcriptional regulator [Bacteria]|uniref:Helix-turn-helix domain protein n=2 Tax=Bacillus cereus group TaxID=86661 RepID=A0A1Y5YS93_9BACI|nr:MULTISPECIES: hypothetical protein [Bacteria]AAS45087.1 hypothetical protein BCE_A0239 [Bacillus cereus ATCC 10987]EJR09862.1 hypothetical protein II9_05339 [Bacillus cereus MSX-D12]OXL92966.1 hypothetical protein B6N65_25395 [Bacillus sp. KbaB1]KMQ28592.1 hypothetical protein TU53_23265 [Bacillus cereus]KXX95881.1 hypothetical protein AT277_14820 [Bacillus cereus]